ncbi:MAG: TIGR04540 family protein [Clostridium butyricum]|nr:TIGR04540 family protein [Clostridium butyricum]
MRLIYKNPRELATCLKDIVDNYYEDLITYDKMSEKIVKIVNANKEAVYKEKSMSVKISNILGADRVKIIDEIVAENE